MTPRQQILGQYVNQLIADGILKTPMTVQEKAKTVLRCAAMDISAVMGVAGSSLAQAFFASLTERIARTLR